MVPSTWSPCPPPPSTTHGCCGCWGPPAPFPRALGAVPVTLGCPHPAEHHPWVHHMGAVAPIPAQPLSQALWVLRCRHPWVSSTPPSTLLGCCLSPTPPSTSGPRNPLGAASTQLPAPLFGCSPGADPISPLLRLGSGLPGINCAAFVSVSLRLPLPETLHPTLGSPRHRLRWGKGLGGGAQGSPQGPGQQLGVAQPPPRLIAIIKANYANKGADNYGALQRFGGGDHSQAGGPVTGGWPWGRGGNDPVAEIGE